jgi:Tail-tube assembly protein
MSDIFSNPTFGIDDGQLSSFGSNQNSNDKETKAKSYRYPLRRIESKSDYLEIRVIEYIPPGFKPGAQKTNENGEAVSLPTELATIGTGTETNRNQKPLKYIYLPIPQNLSDTNSITWGDDTLDPLAAFGLQTGQKLMQGNVSNVVNSFLDVAGDTGSLIKTNKNLITAALGGALYNALGGSVSYQGIISRATGQVLNPNLELLFQGVNIRSFPFVFDFAPRDEREAKEVKEIIRAFKYHMSPKSKSTGSLGKVFIKSPDIFLVAYKSGNKSHPFLNKFKPMALTDMQLTYTGSGTYSTYQDGTPVHMQMTLTFKELNPIYSEDYDELKSQGDTSVGY